MQALIVFGRRADDPASPPWPRIIRAFYLVPALKKLQRSDPSHPLVAVFQPLLISSDAALEKAAAYYYKIIESSNLPARQRDAFVEVFVDWLMQRFATRTPTEIRTMIAELTPIEETVAGRELIGIGIEKGRQEGKLEGRLEGMVAVALAWASSRFGTLEPSVSKRIQELSANDLTKLSLALSDMAKPDDLKRWVSARKKR